MPENAEPETSRGFSPSILILLISIAFCVMTGLVWYSSGNVVAAVLCLIGQTVLVSIVIWQACDPFADAAEFVGHVFKLPGSVRGATLDAIASSMPELFTGIFFVVVLAMGGTPGSEVSVGGEGFASTVATCAGSAVYNMILIPAICAIFISYYRKSRPTIDIERQVITRDGAWFVAMEILLIIFLVQKEIHWWMGVVFLCGYVLYVLMLYLDARRFRKELAKIEALIATGKSPDEAMSELASKGMNISRDLSRRFSNSNGLDDDESEGPGYAEAFFGKVKIPLNQLTCWLIIITATAVAATACYWLVEITKMTAEKMQVDIFFVAVILAAAASSVPDTFLSVASSKKGDDDGAVSNAFGSNIFDISVCISIPLLVACYLNDWHPIELKEQGPIAGLQIMLAGLTLVTLGIISHKMQLTRNKAFFLCGLYALFIAYAILGSMGVFG